MKVMKTPATVIPVMPRIDKKYIAPDDAPACLVGHPKSNSFISQAAQWRSRNPLAPITAPPDKEGRCLDNIGKRFRTTSGTTVRVANALAILARYDCQMCSDIAPYMDLFRDDQRLEARKILLEGERSA